MPASRFQLSVLVQRKLRELNLNAEEVIRKALDIKGEGFDAGEGVHLSEGTVLLAWYKDAPYTGRIKEGEICVNDKCFTSLSGAAASITGRPTTNGWDFWLSVKFPGKNEFVPLKSLRKPAQ
jgi:hypothetical protein